MQNTILKEKITKEPDSYKTKQESIKTHIDRVSRSFASGKTKSLAWRTSQLKALDQMLLKEEVQFLKALKSDLGKGTAEAITSEIAFVRSEIDYCLSNLKGWLKKEKVSTPMLLQPSKSYIVREPLGVVLIIGSWNLPVAVLLGPMLGAIAAGNAVVLKPSEIAPATSNLLAKLLPEYLDTDSIALIEGGIEETTYLLEESWGHIFYTGNGAVGRIVASSAGKTLSPVTLELGGKSPAYVSKDANISVAAKRLVWSKWMNVGQVCVSPDYIIADEKIVPELIEELKIAIDTFYGKDPSKSSDYGRIINEKHFDRLTNLLNTHEGNVVKGGKSIRQELYMEPTIVLNPSKNSPLMMNEIFGPILPILSVDGPISAVHFINQNSKPLTMSVFSTDRDVVDIFEKNTSSGALVVNDAIVNHRVPKLPFGGVGESGHGAYHGKAGFETFTHRKSVMVRYNILDLDLRYPPFSLKKLQAMRRLIGY